MNTPVPFFRKVLPYTSVRIYNKECKLLECHKQFETISTNRKYCSEHSLYIRTVGKSFHESFIKPSS